MADEPEVLVPEVPKEPELTVEEIEGSRRAQKDRARRLALQEDLAAAKKTIADRDAKDREAEQAIERAKGNFEKIEADLRTQIRDGQEKLTAATEKIDGFGKAARRDKFLDAVMAKGSISNRKIAKAMLGTLDIETAPENFTDKDARDATKLLQREAPEIFGAGSSTDPKPPPSSGKAHVESGSVEESVARAKAISGGALSPAYIAATGRGT